VGFACAVAVLGLVGAAVMATKRKNAAAATTNTAVSAHGGDADIAVDVVARGRLSTGSEDEFQSSGFTLDEHGGVRAASVRRENPAFRHSIVDGVTVDLSPV